MTGFAKLDGLDFPQFDPGTVWLVGAGPGAPGLLTLLGYHALAQADAIVYDALVNPMLLDMARPEAERIPAGKRGGKPSPRQADISDSLVALAREGKRVLRLKGGDPFMFGRGGEEAGVLFRAGIRFRVVPGISSGLGGLAYAGIPVTHRDANHSVLFLTGHDETGDVTALDWDAIHRAAPVLVMFMSVKHISTITARLMAAGRPANESVAIVSNAALPQQTVIETTLGAVAGLDDIPTPAIVVVGPASRHRAMLDWYAGDLRENPLG
ncbi:Uroporphyrinogen-III methyltransferase [Devosia sp. DBB001]|nr:Uroporphyrinogen-III methyltransferase [Devosia sp. DBB001]